MKPTELFVLIPFNGECVALTYEQFQQARERGRDQFKSCHGTQACAHDEILDADGMQARTGVPASWWLAQARQKKVPSLRIGKYCRFELTSVLTALRNESRHADRLSAVPRKLSGLSGS